MKHGSLSQVAIGKCLVPDMESSFWITDVEITHNNTHSIGICKPVRVIETQSARSLSQGKVRSKMGINNNEVVSPRLYVHKVFTAVTSNQMCHNSIFRLNVLVNADSRSFRVFVVL